MTPPKTRSTSKPKKAAKTLPRSVDRDGRFERNPDSVPSQLEALAVGDSYTRGARIPMDEFMADEVSEWFTKTTRVLSMQVARTKERNPKREYSIERVQGMAHASANMLCSIIVTRTQ